MGGGRPIVIDQECIPPKALRAPKNVYRKNTAPEDQAAYVAHGRREDDDDVSKEGKGEGEGGEEDDPSDIDGRFSPVLSSLSSVVSRCSVGSSGDDWTISICSTFSFSSLERRRPWRREGNS